MASDLPNQAIDRLNSMKSKNGQPGFFTSDLSVNEFLLVKEAGFEPVGMVLGSSIYHIGYQQSNWNKNQEMTVLTQAMYHARELAMTRMEEEADALGADGIIGVRLEIRLLEWGEGLAEFVAVGTAVTARDRSIGFRTVQNKPFTSDLSGQDFWTLLRSGYRPVGLVMGNCVYHIAHRSLGQALRQAGRNMEMTNFTQALYDSRELAMERMQEEALQLKAEGIVGVTIQEGNFAWGGHIIEFNAIGTAVIAMRADHEIPTPQLTLNVND